jgi:hypothetical protein
LLIKRKKANKVQNIMAYTNENSDLSVSLWLPSIKNAEFWKECHQLEFNFISATFQEKKIVCEAI